MACRNQIQTTTLEQSQLSVPTEIIVEILFRLSAKSLLRCRSVCKLWHSLISDPYFINSKYLSSSTSSTSNIGRHRLIFLDDWQSNIIICNLSDALYHKSVSNKVLTLDKTSELGYDGAVIIAASCNGLVCFYDVNYTSLFIWNPTTRICKRSSLGFCLGIRNAYGFGYDESSDDYKFFTRCQPKAKIYSVKTGMWNTIGDFPHCIPAGDLDGKYSNGALHWVARRTGSYATSGDPWTIVSFHLATETYGQVLQPMYDGKGRGFDMSLGALGEELCMFCYYYLSRSDIWVMKVYGVKDSWTKLFSMPHYMPLLISQRMPLFISNDGKILFKDLTRKLVVYDSKNGSSSEIQNFQLYGRAYSFVESLVSPMPTLGLDNKSGDP